MSQSPATAFRNVCVLLVLTSAGAACAPRGSGDPLVDDGGYTQCRFEPAGAESDRDRQQSLFAIARSGGMIAATSPASRWIAHQTDDGYWLRGGLATGLTGAGFMVVGALAGALLLALKRRKSRPMWGEDLHRRFLDELRAIRGLGIEGEQSISLAALVARFAETLDQLQARSKQLVERCQSLATRGDSTTARAHLVNAEDDLARLLQRVEHLHFEIRAWQHRAESADEAAVDAAIATRLKSLREALEATA